MKQLSTRFSELAERIDTNRMKGDWEAASAFASVPFADTGGRSTREQLWERIANIKKHDREMAAEEPSDTVKITEEQITEEQKRARVRAEKQALAALAALGERWFDDPEVFTAREHGDYASTVKRVRAASEKELDQERPWWLEIAATGDPSAYAGSAWWEKSIASPTSRTEFPTSKRFRIDSSRPTGWNGRSTGARLESLM